MLFNSIKLIKWALPLFPLIFICHPFINGLGCKFTFTQDGEYNFQEGTCKNGIMSVYVLNKNDGSVVVRKMIWGVSGNYIYTYSINQVDVKLSEDVIAGRMYRMYESSRFISGYRVPISDGMGRTLVFYSQPVEVIYINKVKGRVGFFD